MSVNKKLSVSVLFVVVAVTLLSITTMVIPKRTTAAQTEQTATVNTDELTNAAVHLSKERNISVDEAKTRLEWQDKAKELDAELLEELPENDYGGIWIDEETDRVNIGVLNETKLNGSHRNELNNFVSRKNLQDATDFIEVKYSFKQLQKTKEDISASFLKQVGDEDLPLQFGIIPSQNKIQVGIAKDLTKTSEQYRTMIEELKKDYPDMIVYEKYSQRPVQEAECNWWYCDSPLRGAVGLKGHADGYNELYCTAGFNVVGNSGTRYIVTAGHCASGGNGWATEDYVYTPELKIGPIHDNLLSRSGTSKLDAMIIKIREDVYNWDVIGMIMTRSGLGVDGVSPPSYNERYDITGSGANTNELEGERICVSGAVSSYYEGGSCGKVKEVDIDITTCDFSGNNCNHVYKVTRASYCSRGGDSGAPVFRLGKAHGVHIASGPDDTSGNPKCHDEKYYTGMNPILSGIGNISIF